MRQPRKLDQLTGSRLQATDGEIGSLQEVYFDDRRWRVRYFVVRTGGWLHGRTVLLVPGVVSGVDEDDGNLRVELSRAQIENAPPVDGALPVSRHYEREYYRYYGWQPYWESDVLSGAPPRMTPPPGAGQPQPPEHPHLRSSAELKGYRLHAGDGEIGRVSDLVLEEPDWRVRYLEIDTGGWWPGRQVLIAPTWIREVDWALQQVRVEVSRQAVRTAPPYDPAQVISREYQLALYQHYGMQFDAD